MKFKRTDQTMDAYSMEFDVLRERAGPRLAMGGGLPDKFVSILCMQDAPLSKNGTSVALARIQGTMAFTAADFSVREETQRDKMLSWRPTWIRCPKKRIIPPG